MWYSCKKDSCILASGIQRGMKSRSPSSSPAGEKCAQPSRVSAEKLESLDNRLSSKWLIVGIWNFANGQGIELYGDLAE